MLTYCVKCTKKKKKKKKIENLDLKIFKTKNDKLIM